MIPTSTNNGNNIMTFTKKQAGIAATVLSIVLGWLAAPAAGLAAFIGFFILLTA